MDKQENVMRHFFIVIALMLAAGLAHADSTTPGPREEVSLSMTVLGTAFTALPMNTSQTMDTIKVGGLRFVTFYLRYVYGAGTSLSMTCKAGPTSFDVTYTVQVLTQSSGTLTSYDSTWTKSTGSANFSVPWTVATNGYNYLQCTWSVGGTPTASDKLTVTASGSVF